MTVNDPTLFPFRHDWGQPFTVTRAWKTDVEQAADGSEVRAQLRSAAAVSCAMRVQFGNEYGAGRLLDAWRSASQPLRYYVPLWCDASDLTTDLAGGESTVDCDTTDRPFFEDGGFAMLYRENVNAVQSAELVTIDTVSAASLTITGAVTNAYTVGPTRVVPCRIMWLTLPVTLTWQAGRVAQADLQFVQEVDQAGYALSAGDVTATESSIDIFHGTSTNTSGFIPYETNVVAIVKDALGIPIANKAVTWSASSGSITITPSIDSRWAKLYVNTSASSFVTATCGAVSRTFGVN